MLTRISPGTVDDIPAIMPVMESAFHPAFGEAWTEAQCRNMLALPGSWLLVGHSQDQVVSFALLRTIFDECELMMIAVHPNAQSIGAGSAMFGQIIARCCTSNVRKIHIEVRADNAAIDFYLKRGCVVVGNRPNYYQRNDGGPNHALTLVLEVKSTK
jgi:[ribosomal protein S18]-alanine N-acetyltransferase